MPSLTSFALRCNQKSLSYTAPEALMCQPDVDSHFKDNIDLI